MRILGVDPGTQRTGAGVIEAHGNRYQRVYSETLSAPKSASASQKLKAIYEFLSGVMTRFSPDVLALENVFYSKDLKAMVKIGEARACAMLAASDCGVNVVEYAPARIKQAVSGNGRATKEQVQQMVRRLLNLKELPPPDSADALAVAICHLHSHTSSLMQVS